MRPGDRPGEGSLPSVRQLVIIRSAMFAGLLMFGAVSWRLHQQRGAVADPEAFGVLRLIGPALAAVAVVAAFAFRGALARIPDATRRGSLKLLAWALGEMAALSCTVYYFLAGDARYFAVGVAAIVATFIIVPAGDA